MMKAKYEKLDRDELIARCIQLEAVIGYLRQEAEEKRVGELVDAIMLARDKLRVVG